MIGVTAVIAVALAAGGAGAQTTDRGRERLFVAAGIVTAVSRTSITIAGDIPRDSRNMRFSVEPSTRFVGKGLFTDLVLRDPPITAARAVKPSDQVTITYRVVGRVRSAVQVRVNIKAS